MISRVLCHQFQNGKIVSAVQKQVLHSRYFLLKTNYSINFSDGVKMLGMLELQFSARSDNLSNISKQDRVNKPNRPQSRENIDEWEPLQTLRGRIEREHFSQEGQATRIVALYIFIRFAKLKTSCRRFGALLVLIMSTLDAQMAVMSCVTVSLLAGPWIVPFDAAQQIGFLYRLYTSRRASFSLNLGN